MSFADVFNQTHILATSAPFEVKPLGSTSLFSSSETRLTHFPQAHTLLSLPELLPRPLLPLLLARLQPPLPLRPPPPRAEPSLTRLPMALLAPSLRWSQSGSCYKFQIHSCSLPWTIVSIFTLLTFVTFWTCLLFTLPSCANAIPSHSFTHI